jgi:hypothetical protein
MADSILPLESEDNQELEQEASDGCLPSVCKLKSQVTMLCLACK